MAISDNLGPRRRRLLLFGPRRQVEREHSPFGERPDRSFRPELLLLKDRCGGPRRRVSSAVLSDRIVFLLIIISLLMLHLDIFIPSSSFVMR